MVFASGIGESMNSRYFILVREDRIFVSVRRRFSNCRYASKTHIAPNLISLQLSFLPLCWRVLRYTRKFLYPRKTQGSGIPCIPNRFPARKFSTEHQGIFEPGRGELDFLPPNHGRSEAGSHYYRCFRRHNTDCYRATIKNGDSQG